MLPSMMDIVQARMVHLEEVQELLRSGIQSISPPDHVNDMRVDPSNNR